MKKNNILIIWKNINIRKRNIISEKITHLVSISIIKSTSSVRPLTRPANKAKQSRTFMSLLELGMPKKACYIHRLYIALALRTIVDTFYFPVYYPFQSFGQYFHVRCMQSKLPNMLGKPRSALPFRILPRSCAVRALRYSVLKTSTTAP
jgi:hypothetical protein